MIKHPDTIPDLVPDCREALRTEYQRIQAIEQSGPVARGYNSVTGRTEALYPAGAPTSPSAKQAEIAAAITEYRRVAAMWGVDVG